MNEERNSNQQAIATAKEIPKSMSYIKCLYHAYTAYIAFENNIRNERKICVHKWNTYVYEMLYVRIMFRPY